MEIDSLASRAGEWLRGEGRDSDIVISGSRELEKMEAQRLRAGKFLV